MDKGHSTVMPRLIKGALITTGVITLLFAWTTASAQPAPVGKKAATAASPSATLAAKPPVVPAKTPTKAPAPAAVSSKDKKVTVTPGKVVVTPDPTYPKDVPGDVGQAITKGSELVTQAKAGKWLLFSAGIIWMIMFLFKWGRKTFKFMQQIPKRVMWIIVPVLSVTAMILAVLQGNLSWEAGIQVGLSGPVMAYINDFFKRGVMGKEPASTIKGSALVIPEWAKDKE